MGHNKPLILVAEDDQTLAGAYESELTAAGYEIAVVGNGVQVMDFLTKSIPDLVVLDLMMPEMDGFEVLRRMQTDLALVKIPVLVATNMGKEDGERALSMGARAYLVKSEMSLDDLKTKIRLYVGAST